MTKATRSELLNHARLLAENGQGMALKQLCGELRKLAKRNPKHLTTLADVTLLTGDFTRAGKYALKALGERPDDYLAHACMGKIFQNDNKFGPAIEHYRKSLTIRPGQFDIHYNLGLIYQNSDNPVLAEIEYKEALNINPDATGACANLGSLLSKRGNHSSAVHYWQHAASLAPADTRITQALAATLVQLNRYEEAVACYRQALTGRLPQDIQLLLNLIVLLVNIGRYQEAAACCKDILCHDPANIQANLAHAELDNRLGNTDPAIARIEPILERDPANLDALITYGNIARRVRRIRNNAVTLIENRLAAAGTIGKDQASRLHFIAGMLRDAQSSYDRAFQHFDLANNMKQAAFNTTQFNSRIEQVKQVYSKENRGLLAVSTEVTECPVFIVGMPRSGSTLVEQILGSHPDVFAAGELPNIAALTSRLPEGIQSDKQYPHCATEITSGELTELAKEYLAYVQELAPDTRFVTDKMPHNFFHLGFISQILPNCRVIDCRRDPRDVCLSCFFQDFFGGSDLGYTFDLSNLVQFYRRYDELMTHWHEVLDVRMYSIRYEDLVVKPEDTVRHLLEFCNLPWDDACLKFHESQRSIATASYAQVKQKLYTSSIDRWKHYEKHIPVLMRAFGRPGS